MNQYLSTESKEYQLMALQNRLQVIQEKGKTTQGVIRKLKRQIRNLKCDILLQRWGFEKSHKKLIPCDWVG